MVLLEFDMNDDLSISRLEMKFHILKPKQKIARCGNQR